MNNFFRNVSMAYSTKRYSVVEKAIYKTSYFMLNIFFNRTHTQLSVSELLECGARCFCPCDEILMAVLSKIALAFKLSHFLNLDNNPYSVQ